MPIIGVPLITLQSVDSTNNYAMAQVHVGLATHGTGYLALEQTAGKGQRGKEWLTAPGESIALSIVFQPQGLLTSHQFFLSVTVALSCYDLVKYYAGPETKIKWPNDIYWCDRKAGGILIENVIQAGEWKYAIAGMGLNLNQITFPSHLPGAISLKQITGISFDVLQTAAKLCEFLQARYQELQDRKQDYLLEEYNAVLYKRDERVRLRRDNVVFDTIVKGVNRQGSLVTKNSIDQIFNWGEVDWIG